MENIQTNLTFLAFIVFGWASWIMTNATYIELSIFLKVLPEKYSVSAFSIFALQSANIYPIIYMAVNGKYQLVSQSNTIWILLILGILIAFPVFMSVSWDTTAVVFGAEHSIVMLILTHFGGLLSATSSVVFYPYVATFPSIYTSALSTGEGLGGSIAALLGLIQQPYNDLLNICVGVFYFICGLLMIGSVIAFGYLQYHPWAISERCRRSRQSYEEKAPLTGPFKFTKELPQGEIESSKNGSIPGFKMDYLTQLLICQFLLATFSFALIPSIMPYVYKKYAAPNDVAGTSRYQSIASVTAPFLDPLARLSTCIFRVYHVRRFTIFLLVIGMMLLIMSLISHPWESHPTSNGYLFPLISHILYVTVYAYTQTMIYICIKKKACSDKIARKTYQWSGLCTQIGALCGTSIIFPLILFKENWFS